MNNEYIMHKVHDYDLLWKDSSNTDGLVNNAALTVLIEGQHFTHIQISSVKQFERWDNLF
jgi:hypothetical protein